MKTRDYKRATNKIHRGKFLGMTQVGMMVHDCCDDLRKVFEQLSSDMDIDKVNRREFGLLLDRYNAIRSYLSAICMKSKPE